MYNLHLVFRCTLFRNCEVDYSKGSLCPVNTMKTKNIDNETELGGERDIEVLMGGSMKLVAIHSDHPNGLSVPNNDHEPVQFLYASRGVMTVNTSHGSWVVPESHAVWIPSNVRHKFEAREHLTLHSLLIKSEMVPDQHEHCRVVVVLALLREAIIYAASFKKAYAPDSHEERLVTIILDLLQKLETVPFLLPAPQDQRLKTIASFLIEHPEDKTPLEAWAERVGATTRTLSRLFRKETGMTFKEWRRQAKIQEAIRLLAAGEQVSSIAFSLGYNSVSAFVAMFKKQLGYSPGRYLERSC